jgi:hypothetical protein
MKTPMRVLILAAIVTVPLSFSAQNKAADAKQTSQTKAVRKALDQINREMQRSEEKRKAAEANRVAEAKKVGGNMQPAGIMDVVSTTIVNAKIFALLGADSEPKPLASRLVYQFGGPQSRTRCVSTRVISDNFITGKVIVCDRYATDFEQHALYIDWFAPNVENADQQTREIAEACLVSGVALAVGATVLNPAIAVTFFSDKIDTIEAGVRACVATQALLSRVVTGDVDLRVRRLDFWLD